MGVMVAGSNEWAQAVNVASGYLGREHFGRTLVVALLLHILAVAAFIWMAAQEETTPPTRSLQLRLGSSSALEAEVMDALAPLPQPAPAQPATPPAKPAEADQRLQQIQPLNKPTPPAPKAAPAAKPKLKPKPAVRAEPPATPKAEQRRRPSAQAEPVAAPAPAAEQAASGEAMKRVRIGELNASAQPEIPANVPALLRLPEVFPPVKNLEAEARILNTEELARNPHGYLPRETTTAEASAASSDVTVGPANQQDSVAAIRARYEQKISAWLQQHRIYPSEAQEQKLAGNPLLRVRMDRSGNVKLFIVDRSSGHDVLDQAALQMVNRANPFPAPPENYPGGALLEFLIPVTFKAR